MSHQLDLFHTGTEVTRLPTRDSPKTRLPSVRCGVAWSKTAPRDTKVSPEHQASRGDLFREQFEMRRNIALAEKPDLRTFEDIRADLYWRLYWNSVFPGRRRLKGPVDQLKRKVGRNRCAELDVWLRRVGAKGSTTSVRYRNLLARVEREICDVESSFKSLTTERFSSDSSPARWARAQLAKAQSDVAELHPLFSEVAVLYRQLRQARLNSVRPPGC